MRTFIYLVLIVLCAVLLESCIPHKREINEPIEPDSIEQEYVPTVYEMLEAREEWKYQIFIDSVYLQIPEPIIVHMFVTKGTTISEQEIVEDYLANKQFYHDTILKSMEIQKIYIPDSLPRNKNELMNNITNT